MKGVVVRSCEFQVANQEYSDDCTNVYTAPKPIEINMCLNLTLSSEAMDYFMRWLQKEFNYQPPSDNTYKLLK